MKIIINEVGVSTDPGKEDEIMYEVKVDSKPVFSFIHDKNDPLSVCLAKASNAANLLDQVNNIFKEDQLEKT